MAKKMKMEGVNQSVCICMKRIEGRREESVGETKWVIFLFFFFLLLFSSYSLLTNWFQIHYS